MRGRWPGLMVVAGWLLFSPIVSSVERAEDVPFRLYRGYSVVVQGSIGKLSKLHFLIDTGAVPSVIDRRIAAKLRLTGTHEKLPAFNREAEAEWVVLPRVQLGAIRTGPLPVLVSDLSFLEKGLATRIDAMVGLDVLRLSNFTLDYTSRRMRFGPAESLASSAPFEAGLPYVLVQANVQGCKLRLVLDTGAKDLVLFEARVLGRLPTSRILGAKVSFSMAGGEVPLRRVELSSLRLGDADLGNSIAFLMQGSVRSLVEFDGLLGPTSLGIHRIRFDFQRNVVTWD